MSKSLMSWQSIQRNGASKLQRDHGGISVFEYLSDKGQGVSGSPSANSVTSLARYRPKPTLRTSLFTPCPYTPPQHRYLEPPHSLPQHLVSRCPTSPGRQSTVDLSGPGGRRDRPPPPPPPAGPIFTRQRQGAFRPRALGL